jgi:aryl-alcohol dehydrogenase-like predicted oxidoreductase
MALPDSAYTVLRDDMKICRILNGLWQVSGAHGEIDPNAAIDDMIAYHEAGFTTWDLADHYGPAEEFIAQLRKQLKAKHGDDALNDMLAFTKWVPRPIRITREVVEEAVDLSMQRMQVDVLDMMQFHWWEYRDSGYLSAVNHLSYMVIEGKIRHLGLTNFDTRHVENIMTNGVRISSNQVQYSVIDQRPEVKMVPLFEDSGLVIFAYGALAGGLLTDRFLGQPEPTDAQLDTASLRKYKRIIDMWGDWALFQELLQTMRGIADKYGVSIANIAVRYVVDKPAVAGVIVGTRLSVSEHREETVRVFDFELDTKDLDAIHDVTDTGNDLYKIIGDCGDEYRR